MPDTTVVYYTCNRDWPKLEEAVRRTIAQNSNGLPIVSVSRLPMDFGDNIVVGDAEWSCAWDDIFLKQRLGVERAKTKYVAICEADFLLPPAFFAFCPPHNKLFCWPRDGYISFEKRPSVYFPKRLTQTVGIVGRDYYMGFMDFISRKGTPGYAALVSLWDKGRGACEIPGAGSFDAEMFDLGPVVTLKTVRQVSKKSPHDRHNAVRTLPEWGSAETMWEQCK